MESLSGFAKHHEGISCSRRPARPNSRGQKPRLQGSRSSIACPLANLAKIIENARLRVVASCVVSYLDTEGLRHTVEVEAESLYEAAVLAIRTFRQNDCEPGNVSTLEVEVRSSVIHTIYAQEDLRLVERRCQDAKRSSDERAIAGTALERVHSQRIILGSGPPLSKSGSLLNLC